MDVLQSLGNSFSSADGNRRGGAGLVNARLNQRGEENVPDGTKAIFSIKVLRTGVNVAATAIPFVLMAGNWASNGYQGFFDNPVGLTYQFLTPIGGSQVVDAGNPVADFNSILFKWSDDAGTSYDTIKVTALAAANYPTILQMLANGEKIEFSKIRMKISDAAQLTQFDEPMQFAIGRMFGVVEKNPITVDSQKSPYQFQDGIVDIDVNGTFGGNIGIISNIIAVTGFSVVYTFYVK